MGTVSRPVCAGSPLDSAGNARETINDCPFAPTAVCMGLHPGPEGEPVTLLITACDLHKWPVHAFVGRWNPEDAVMYPIEALPVIAEELTGVETYTLTHAAA